MDKLRQYLYYILIGIISLISLCFLPFLGSTMGLGWNVPDTTAGWIVWIGSKVIVAFLNVLLFHCFMQQGKLNVQQDDRYKKATELLMKEFRKEGKPVSPARWLGKEYGTKAILIFITSAAATVALGQAILSFDWVSLIAYIFTILMGLIFGVLQMKKAEWYWTEEYLRYAEYVKLLREKKEKEEKDDNS